MFAQFVGMSATQDDVSNIGKLRQNIRQGVEYVFDSLIRREQTKREKHYAAFYTKLVLEISRIHEPDVGNAMQDYINFGQGRVVNLCKHLPPALRHHYKPCGKGDQLL